MPPLVNSWRRAADGHAFARRHARKVGRRALDVEKFELGEPFELGANGSFQAPAGGQLYLRCGDKWGELADNNGTLTIKLKAAAKVK